MLVMTRWEKETRILLLSGRFDKSARVPVETALATGEDRRCSQVILDLSKVSSMDSAGIGKLLLLYHSLRKNGVALTVMNPRPSVEELLHLVNLATLFPIVHHKSEIRFVA
jgi:anti-sigma B factor antagonist